MFGSLGSCLEATWSFATGEPIVREGRPEHGRVLSPAFMVAQNGVSARVSSGGADLPEYASSYDAVTNTISCWVPSEVGKVRRGVYSLDDRDLRYVQQSYKMYLTRDTRQYATAAYFYADNHFLGCKLLEPTDKADEFSCAGVRVSATSVQPLLFSQPGPESECLLSVHPIPLHDCYRHGPSS